jgi:hypothetical protein
MMAVAIAGLALGVVVLVALAGRWHFQASIGDDVERLFGGAAAAVGPEDLRRRRDDLPEPIQRYLGYAIGEGARAVRTVRLRHDGEFRTGPDKGWLHIEGEEYFATARPGFVWDARVWPLPGVWIEARDRLLDGAGNMLVKLMSLVPLADAGGAEIDQGARLRWLGECAWFPYALVGDQVAWEPIDSRSAAVMLRGDGLPVRAVVEIDEEGRLGRLRADRYRDIGGGKAALTPWTGRYFDYREVGGFRIPMSVEVAWELDGGPFAYARFHLTSVEYDVAARF